MKLCRYLGDKFADCNCSTEKIASYQRKISGPLLDRIDLHVEVLRPSIAELRGTGEWCESWLRQRDSGSCTEAV